MEMWISPCRRNIILDCHLLDKLCSNKGGGPRISCAPGRKSSVCMFISIWLDVEFRKAPLANVTMLVPGVCWFGRYSVMRTHAFIPAVWFRRERREPLFFVASSLIHGESETENFWLWTRVEDIKSWL
jgi:hypothetical protein